MDSYYVPPVWLRDDPTVPVAPRQHRHNDCWCGTSFHPIPWWPTLRGVNGA